MEPDFDFKCIDPGEWYTEYECTRCGFKYIEQADDSFAEADARRIHVCARVAQRQSA